MPRLPYAAKTLIREVEAQRAHLKSRPKITKGDPDGLGVIRTVRFDKATSAYLAPLLEVVNDKRITEHSVTDAGYLYVTFSTGHNADTRVPFDLADAEVVAKG